MNNAGEEALRGREQAGPQAVDSGRSSREAGTPSQHEHHVIRCPMCTSFNKTCRKLIAHDQTKLLLCDVTSGSICSVRSVIVMPAIMRAKGRNRVARSVQGLLSSGCPKVFYRVSFSEA